MKLKTHLAVVIHWDGGAVKNGDIDGLIRWMRDERKDGAFYHFFVSGTRLVAGAPETDKTIHCGNTTYTEIAQRYFGDYCPSWDHREFPHPTSPNNCTLGVCMLHDYEDGRYSDETLRTGAKLAAGRLGAYDLGMEGLWDHTMIVGTETKLCPQAFYIEHSQKPAFWDLVAMDMVAIESMYSRIPR